MMQIKYTDMLGQSQTLAVTGWHARIVQHELDHLSGKLYVDCMHCRTFAMDDERLQHAPSNEDVLHDGAHFHRPAVPK